MAVLHHHIAISVIYVHQRKGLAWQTVEEQFLCSYILGIGAVIVQVVVREVGKECTTKPQASHTVLHQRVRRHLHEAVFAAAIDHLAQHGIKTYGVGRGVCRWHLACVDAVDDRRDKSCAVAHSAIEVVEQCGYCCLAVCTRHTHQMQFVRRVVVKCGSHICHRRRSLLHHDVTHIVVLLLGQTLTHNGTSTSLNGLLDVLVTVALRAPHCKEAATLADAARVVGKSRNLYIALCRKRDDGCCG